MANRFGGVGVRVCNAVMQYVVVTTILVHATHKKGNHASYHARRNF